MFTGRRVGQVPNPLQVFRYVAVGYDFVEVIIPVGVNKTVKTVRHVVEIF